MINVRMSRHRLGSVRKHGGEYACAEWLLKCGSSLCRFDDEYDVHNMKELKSLLKELPEVHMTHADASDSVVSWLVQWMLLSLG